MIKTFKIIILTLLVVIIPVLIYIIYILIADIQTKVPESVQLSYNIQTKIFENRNIHIISKKDENRVKANMELDFNDTELQNVEQNQKVIIYFHGGAYFGEGTTDHWEFIQNIVEDTNSIVIFPDYPLAPKYSYKDVYNMVIPLYEAIINEIEKLEVDKNQNIEIILMGDSAGGGIALGILQEIIKKEEDIRLPNETILISPWLDVRLENPEINEIEKYDDILNKRTLKLAGIEYAENDGIESNFVNPILGDMTGIENLTIMAAEYDILTPDAHLLVENAKKQGIEVELIEYEKAKHIWFIENNSSVELNKKGYEDLVKLIIH